MLSTFDEMILTLFLIFLFEWILDFQVILGEFL